MTWTEKTRQAETWSGVTAQTETWTGATEQAETWTSQATLPGIFSTLVFSHASHSGSRVFSMTSTDGVRDVWDSTTEQSETWAAA